MKVFTTSIFVPETKKKETNLIKVMETDMRLNAPVALPSDLYHGGLDDIQEGEEFVLVVNGPHHKHEIKMKGCSRTAGKIRFMFTEPEKQEVYCFAEWRLKTTNLMSCKNKTQLQLRNFTASDLRRLIRHSVSNQERQLVKYR